MREVVIAFEKNNLWLIVAAALVATLIILWTQNVYSEKTSTEYASTNEEKTADTIITNMSESEELPSNIKKAEPTPSSCTPTQNCGSPTCAATRGGGCGCGSR